MSTNPTPSEGDKPSNGALRAAKEILSEYISSTLLTEHTNQLATEAAAIIDAHTNAIADELAAALREIVDLRKKWPDWESDDLYNVSCDTADAALARYEALKSK